MAMILSGWTLTHVKARSPCKEFLRSSCEFVPHSIYFVNSLTTALTRAGKRRESDAAAQGYAAVDRIFLVRTTISTSQFSTWSNESSWSIDLR